MPPHRAWQGGFRKSTAVGKYDDDTLHMDFFYLERTLAASSARLRTSSLA